MAMTCSAMGCAYAPTFPATMMSGAIASKSTLSRPADSIWMNRSPGALCSAPAGTSRLSRSPISTSARRSTSACSAAAIPSR